MNKIEIKDLCLVFGKDGCVIAVNNVNLSIQEGEIFVIMDFPEVENRHCCGV